MISAYLDDLLYQPTALQATLDSLEKAAPLTGLGDQLRCDKFKRVILTGMGSSYHALYPLQLRLFASSVNAIRLETAELIHYAPKLIHPSSLIIAVSQSGESAEVVHLCQLSQGMATLVGVTNTPGSALSQRASYSIITAAGEESSVSCKTYISALAALTWLGDNLLDGRSLFPSLAGLPEIIANYWSSWQDHVALLSQTVANTIHFFLLGRGASLAAAQTGALIIKEAARVVAEGMSSAAFRHGPIETISPLAFSMIYLGAESTSVLNALLAQDICDAGGLVELVGIGNFKPPFSLPSCSASALPILEIMPAQLLSLALAEMQGIQPGQFIHSSKVTVTE